MLREHVVSLQSSSCCDLNLPVCSTRYAAHKQMLKAPLLDPTVPEDKLAAWIHEHTMHVHQFLDEQVCF